MLRCSCASSSKSNSGNLSSYVFMWIILILFPFSISVLTICTIPSLEYVLSIRPLRLVPGNGTPSCYLLGSNFCLLKYTVQFLQTYWCSIDVFQAFSIDNGAFFACFLLINRTIVSFFEEFFYFPIQWQASLSLLDAFISILSKISITFSSRFWSSTSSRIPVISRLFLRLYCSKELFFSSSEITFFQGCLFYCVVFGFQPVNIL